MPAGVLSRFFPIAGALGNAVFAIAVAVQRSHFALPLTSIMTQLSLAPGMASSIPATPLHFRSFALIDSITLPFSKISPTNNSTKKMRLMALLFSTKERLWHGVGKQPLYYLYTQQFRLEK